MHLTDRLAGTNRNVGGARTGFGPTPPYGDDLEVGRRLDMGIDNTKFHRVVNQPVPAPASKQPTSIPNSEQKDAGPRPLPPGSTHRLEPVDEHLVIENLPAVRVAARRIFRLLPDHVSFARIYSAGVSGLGRRFGGIPCVQSRSLCRLCQTQNPGCDSR
jgi:hypothetical protein